MSIQYSTNIYLGLIRCLQKKLKTWSSFVKEIRKKGKLHLLIIYHEMYIRLGFTCYLI